MPDFPVDESEDILQESNADEECEDDGGDLAEDD